MPELPEVEVVRRDLEREIVGKRVKSVEVDGMRSVRRHHNRKQFITRIEGKKFTSVERRGKYLLARLEGGDVLIIHLGMSGRLLLTPAHRKAVERHEHVAFETENGSRVGLIDPRRFGSVDLVTFSPDGRLLALHSINCHKILEVAPLLGGRK